MRTNGRYRIIKSKNYEDMIQMFIEAGLEVSPNEPAPKGLLVCFEMFDTLSGRRIGGASLTKEYGEYVIRTVAIEKEYQGQGLGKQLVEAVIREAEEWDAKRLILNAKVPGFYEKLGFSVVKRESAPPISDCNRCPRFGNGCSPEIMQLIV